MLYIFNTTIAPTPGLTYHTHIISAVHARALIAEGPWVSAVGHDATAVAASTLFGVPVQVNRNAAQMSPGDRAICIKLRGRLPEGVILDSAQLEEIGYDLVLMTAVASLEYPERAWAATMRALGATLLSGPDDDAGEPTHPGLPDMPGAHHVVTATRANGEVVGTVMVGTGYQCDVEPGRLNDISLLHCWRASGGSIARAAAWEHPVGVAT